MYYVNRNIQTKEEGKAFVSICDRYFDGELSSIVHKIIHGEHPDVILLAGPTCAGKTTTANKLIEEITAAGKNARILSIDDFFRENLANNKADEEIDFDSVAAIDLPLLASCTEKILRGEKTTLPKYDFVTGRRLEGIPYIPTPDDIVIFEGIQAVYPEVVALFRAYSYVSIFITVDDDITVNGVFFSRTDIRLARRIVRDYRFRAASPEYSLILWKGVRRNEEANIFPYMHQSHHIINSLLPYEVFMIAQYLLPLLESVPAASPYYSDARRLHEKFTAVGGSSIDPIYLAENSLYHEFLG